MGLVHCVICCLFICPGCLEPLIFAAMLNFSYVRSRSKIDLEEKFKPTLLNSTVYIMSVALQITTFAVNYRVCSFSLVNYSTSFLSYHALS